LDGKDHDLTITLPLPRREVPEREQKMLAEIGIKAEYATGRPLPVHIAA